jgi:hypothetical protein
MIFFSQTTATNTWSTGGGVTRFCSKKIAPFFLSIVAIVA